MSGRFVIYGASLVMHAALALSVTSLDPKVERREPTKITIKEVKKPKQEKPAPPPEPPPPPPPAPPTPAPAKPAKPPKPAPEAAAPPPSAAPSAAATSAAPSFGLTLGAGSSGGGGIAVAAPAPAAAPAEVVKKLGPKTLTPPKQPTAAACNEPLVKAKPIEVKQPAYTSQAREAGVSGKVRVELRVDTTGRVVSARVLEGLGHGLDEAALEAARGSRFEPATQCGVAAETSFVIGIRFNL
jgi:periplasmic protein TonB